MAFLARDVWLVCARLGLTHAEYAQVTIDAPPTGGKPTGKVTFWSDGLAISPALDLVDGQAAYNYTGFMVGSHSVFATYSGGGACPLGVSASILRQVGRFPPPVFFSLMLVQHQSASLPLQGRILGPCVDVPLNHPHIAGQILVFLLSLSLLSACPSVLGMWKDGWVDV
jgi:hypothetical protein